MDGGSTGALLTACYTMTQVKSEKTTQRLEAQHDELLRKIDELDKRVAEVLAEWAQISEQDLCGVKPAGH